MDNIFTKEEIEEAKKDEIRELLLEAFDGKSVLYDIYKKRGWLDRLFTEKILSMDKNALYMSNQVAEICETKDHSIKNKRKELLDYVQPEIMGDGNTKIYKHNYISVFKLKMIDGLTGEGSEFTLPQLKELLYGTKPATSTGPKPEGGNEILFQILSKMELYEKKMGQFDSFQQLVQNGEFFKEIEQRSLAAVQSLLTDGSDDEEVKKEVISLYDRILSPDTTLAEKEQLVSEFLKLEDLHTNQAFTIRMYMNAAEERLVRFKQDEKEINARKVKEKVLEHFEDYEQTTKDTERERIRSLIEAIANENPDLNFEIRFWLYSRTVKEKKRGFWGRMFS
jgi:hypothetical protein